MYSHISSKSAYVTNIASDVGKKHLLHSLTGKGNGCYHEIFEEPKVTIFFLLMHLLAQLLQGPAGVKLYGLGSQRLQIFSLGAFKFLLVAFDCSNQGAKFSLELSFDS